MYAVKYQFKHDITAPHMNTICDSTMYINVVLVSQFHMSMYVEIHVGGTSKVKDGLNEQCIMTCKAAVKRLECVWVHLASGEILVKDLLRAKQREQHLVTLYEAASRALVVTSSNVRKDLNQRLQELEAYHSHRNHLNHLLSNAKLPAHTCGT